MRKKGLGQKHARGNLSSLTRIAEAFVTFVTAREKGARGDTHYVSPSLTPPPLILDADFFPLLSAIVVIVCRFIVSLSLCLSLLRSNRGGAKEHRIPAASFDQPFRETRRERIIADGISTLDAGIIRILVARRIRVALPLR